MQHRYEYRLTRDEYVTGLMALSNQLASEDRQRTRRIFEQLAIVVAVLLIITILFPQALAGLLVAALLIAIAQGLMRTRWLRSATGISYDPATADHHIEMDRDGIADISTLRNRRWPWAAVRRIHEVQDAIVLELAGWDMIVLPHRIWADQDARRHFLQEVRELATEALPIVTRPKPAPLDAREMITLGAIGAGVDLLAAFVFLFPMELLPARSGSGTAFIVAYLAVLVVALGLAFLAYRLARRSLTGLMTRSPSAAMIAAQALIWPVPLYILASYFGWI